MAKLTREEARDIVWEYARQFGYDVEIGEMEEDYDKCPPIKFMKEIVASESFRRKYIKSLVLGKNLNETLEGKSEMQEAMRDKGVLSLEGSLNIRAFKNTYEYDEISKIKHKFIVYGGGSLEERDFLEYVAGLKDTLECDSV